MHAHGGDRLGATAVPIVSSSRRGRGTSGTSGWPTTHGAVALKAAGSAWGTGKLWLMKPNCTPSYKCPYSTHWVGVYLSTVRSHNGTSYYARIAVEFQYAGAWRWSVGWLGYAAPGATSPMWLFPATPPPTL